MRSTDFPFAVTPQRLQEIAKRIAAIEAAGVEEPRDEEPEGMYRGGLMDLARKYR